VQAVGANQHWTIEASLRDAPEGTYALVFSGAEPANRGWYSIAPTDPGLRCAWAHGKKCTVESKPSEEIVSVSHIGPGGSGLLRATFDVGDGGWFRVMRIEGGSGQRSSVEVQIVSEALIEEETAQRFSIQGMDISVPEPRPRI
jgi:hypothetical protein